MRLRLAVREALRTDPYDDDAWDLPAGFSPKRARSPKHMYDFERAIRLRPGSAPHLYDYALALARADRFDEAQDTRGRGVARGCESGGSA